MKYERIADITLKVVCAVFLAVSLILTFTVSDYYIFNRIGFSEGKFNFFFVISQWAKKSGLLLLPLAIYYNKKCCADIAKYFLPVFVIISLFTYGSFFDVTMLTENASPAEKVYASINEFIPRTANMALFFAASALELICCAIFFIRDGFGVKAKSFIYLPAAFFAVTPLNIFENFYDVTRFGRDSFLWFKNFTVWHFLALAVLIGTTIGTYYFLKNKEKNKQQHYLIAIAVTLLIQYHSKDSFIMGDGYNVYTHVFSCIPLFICNIGVYVSCLSVILKKRLLYSISFFVHAAGALSVFIYFGRDDISNYGIFVSHSILYFCLTHILLFVLSVVPSAVGHYKFRLKDCIAPMIYYCFVIIAAAVASGIVTSASMSFTYGGYTLSESEWIYPNYAFTQINPLPIPCPNVPFTIWKCEFNLLYLIILYLVYVSLFWIFTGGYYGFLAVKRRILQGQQEKTADLQNSPVYGEAAASEEQLPPEYGEDNDNS